MIFQPLRKSFGVLFTAFPDTLRAFRLLQAWQRRALLRCGSGQVCWKSKRLRRIRSLRLCEGNRCIVCGKGQHRRDENSDSSGDHPESSAFAAMWMLCIAPTPASPTAKVTASSVPILGSQKPRQLGDIHRDPSRSIGGEELAPRLNGGY